MQNPPFNQGIKGVFRMEMDYAEIAERFFEQNDWNFEVKELSDGDKMFTLPFSAKNLPGINLKVIIAPNDTCKILAYLANNVPDNKRAAMLEVLNKLNMKFRYLKLVLDSDNDVVASYDFSFYGDEDAAINAIEEMIYLVKSSMDESVPRIMTLIWADDDN